MIETKIPDRFASAFFHGHVIITGLVMVLALTLNKILIVPLTIYFLSDEKRTQVIIADYPRLRQERVVARLLLDEGGSRLVLRKHRQLFLVQVVQPHIPVFLGLWHRELAIRMQLLVPDRPLLLGDSLADEAATGILVHVLPKYALKLHCVFLRHDAVEDLVLFQLFLAGFALQHHFWNII